MTLFSKLYERVMGWAVHRHASWYLAGLSFSESSFFPIPPDVMLAPMALAKPKKAWWFALITTAASVLGGVFGYLIGMFAFELIEPWIIELGYHDRFVLAQQWFETWGFWTVLIAGFSPIPYKVFTIAAGAMGMLFFPFLLASLVGRGARFFMVAGLMRWGGERLESILHSYIDRIGWLMVLAIIVGYFLLQD